MQYNINNYLRNFIEFWVKEFLLFYSIPDIIYQSLAINADNIKSSRFI
jgi:phage-related protein